MKLAKPAVDVGLYTNQLDAMLAFWQEQAGLRFSELLKVGGGVHQHRHAIGDSVLKINHTRAPLATDRPTGMRALEIYSDVVDEPLELLDPDGNEVILSPAAGEHNLCVHMVTNDVNRTMGFYTEALSLAEVSEDRVAVGCSLLAFAAGDVHPAERQAQGLRYLTVQVFDVVGTHQAILAAGGTEGLAPVRLGEVAYISFVRDPDGNWIEISQRKSITGSLE